MKTNLLVKRDFAFMLPDFMHQKGETCMNYTFFYKNIFYKNNEAQNWFKFKNILRIMSGSRSCKTFIFSGCFFTSEIFVTFNYL